MRRSDFLIGGLLFLALFGAYLSMLCPTVYWEDSGELIAAAHGLGIAHPPGHPLWVMLGRVFSIIPVGGIAYRVNLLSSFFSAFAGLVCYFTILILLSSTPLQGRSLVNGSPGSDPIIRISALSAALALSLSGTIWFYSEIAEVYTLLGFFCSVLLLLAVLWKAERRPSLLMAFWYLYGLSLTNNVILLALLPAFLYFLIIPVNHRTIEPSNHRTIEPSSHLAIQPSNYLAMAAAFALGLSLYLYLPIRSRLNPFIDWGNPQTLRNLIALVSAREFTPQFFSLSLTAPGGPLRGLIDYFAGLPRQFAYLGFALGILGFFPLLKTQRRLLLFLLAGMFLSVVFAVFAGGGPDLPAYFIPSYVLFSVLVGVGAFELLRRLRKRLAWVLLPVSIVVLSTLLHSEHNCQRGEWGALVYGRDLVGTMAPDGVLFTENTVDCFLFWYLQGVEKTFPNQLAIYTPLLKEDWYREKLRLKGLWLPEEGSPLGLALSVSSSRPVYYTPGEHWLIDPEHLAPHGIVFRFGGAVDMGSHSSLLKSLDYRGVGGRKTRKHYALIHAHLGEYFYKRGEVREAISEYERAAQIDPQNPGVFHNLGILHQAQDDRGKALKSYERAVDLGSKDSSLRVNLGVLYLKSEDLHQAVFWLERAIRAEETARARYSLGICWLKLGDTEKAIEETKRAIALNPEFPDAYNNLGICYYQTGDYERAAQQFKRALELNPNYSQARYNLEMLRGKSGGP